LGEENRLRISENRMRRRIFGPEKEEVGSWRKLHNDELHKLCSSSNFSRVIKSRRVKWAGHVAHRGEGRGVYRMLVGRPEGKRPLERPWHRWKDNIKRGLRERGIVERTGFGWLRIGSNGGLL
jgi:hypothetical protein